MEDKKLMWQMIDNCWIQSQWSASITPKGGFFCEGAASLDYLYSIPEICIKTHTYIYIQM